MVLRSIITGRRQLGRASEIATILSASGFHWLVDAVGLQACVSLRCRIACSSGLEQCHHHADMDLPLPDRMRDILERLGPTFVKGGQMLALRPDYVPLPFADALRTLHSHATPFAGEQARLIVEHELDAPLGRLFADFEAEPFAAASLSQVHRAALPDGRLVAVKVQRPGIDVLMEQDLALLAFLARRLEHRRSETLGFRPTAAVDELTDYTRRELDFRREARTADRVRRLFADDRRAVIPEVHWDHTTQRVLTMELVEGHSPAPAAELEALGLHPQAIIRAGAEMMVKQIFAYGLFHADAHPGNVLLLPGDRICFLDFGMFGRLTPHERRKMALMFWALVDGDYDALADRLLHLSTFIPGADPTGFRDAVGETVESWSGKTSAEYSVARLLLAVLACGAGHGVVFPRTLMLLGRALTNVESTAAIVDPELTLEELAKPLIPELRKWLLLDPGGLEEAWRRGRFDLLETAFDVPEILPRLAGRLEATNHAAATSNGHGNHVGLALAAGALGGVIAGRAARARR